MTRREAFINEFINQYHPRLTQMSAQLKRRLSNTERAELRRTIRAELREKYPHEVEAVEHYQRLRFANPDGKPIATVLKELDELGQEGAEIEHRLMSSTAKKSKAGDIPSQSQPRGKDNPYNIRIQERRERSDKVREHRSTRYFHLVKQYGYVPPDHVAAHLLGIKHNEVVKLRQQLSNEFALEQRLQDDAPEMTKTYWIATPKVDPRVQEIQKLVESLDSNTRSVLLDILRMEKK